MSEVITNHLDLWTSALLTKSTAGRGSNGKLEAYGIKKLRELILELAVRGKLVPQDPNDEPASVLLEKIAKEKARLVQEGKIAKQKPLPPVSEEEERFDLPSGWEWIRFGNIFELEYGSNLPEAKRTSTSEYPVFGSNGVVGSHDTYCVDRPCIVVGRKGSAGALNLCLNDKCWVTDVAYSVVPPTDMDLKFVFKLFHTLGLDSLGKGIKPGLNRNEAYVLPVAIPPLAQQHRIVAKVDELMALCDKLEQQQTHSLEAHQTLVETLLGTLTNKSVRPELRARRAVEGRASTSSARTAHGSARTEFEEAWTRIANHFDTLFTTEHSIDQLKQTILQLAVTGKLVPQDPNDEPASVLLSRKKDSNEENIPFRIPESWVWARVDEFAQTRLGKMLDKAKNKGELARYLRNANVRWFDFDLSDVKEMRFEESELEEFSLRRGDVLICEGGYPGRAAVWDERDDNIYFQKAIHRVRFKNEVNPNYFVYVLRDSADGGRLNTYFTGAGIQHFTGKGLASFLVPLPPLPEQHRIVAKVDELIALCDALTARIKGAQTTQLHLADTIVEQAVA